MNKKILIDLNLVGNKFENTIIGSNTYLTSIDGALSYGTNGLQFRDQGNVRQIVHSGNKYVTTITGNGVATSFTVTHNLGTQDYIIQVSQNTSPFGLAPNTTDYQRTSNTQATIVFNSAPANGLVYKVYIYAI